jgi:alanine racemase
VTLRCHAKVDTGMGRLGFAWEEAAAALARLVREGGLRVEGLCTHFASGGRAGPGSFAEEQARRFRAVAEQCAARGLAIPFRHIANSAAFLARPDWDLDGVRLGIVAYGYGNRQDRRAVRTRPFLQWKTRVVQVRRVPAGSPVGYSSTHVTPAATQLAVIDVGYSDGYARLLSNKGCVLVGGRRAPVVGRVTMNFTTVDVGPDATVRDGDEAVLIGTQGGASVWADELARQAQTIPYEILTGIRSRPLEAG